MTTHSDFPVMDADRATATTEYGRTVFDVFRPVEAHIAELDDWVAMPLRLVHDQAAGWQIELGPYNLDAADIGTLRRAIAAYDAATGARPAEVPE